MVDSLAGGDQEKMPLKRPGREALWHRRAENGKVEYLVQQSEE
jgi:hypothetical protein